MTIHAKCDICGKHDEIFAGEYMFNKTWKICRVCYEKYKVMEKICQPYKFIAVPGKEEDIEQ